MGLLGEYYFLDVYFLLYLKVLSDVPDNSNKADADSNQSNKVYGTARSALLHVSSCYKKLPGDKFRTTGIDA